MKILSAILLSLLFCQVSWTQSTTAPQVVLLNDGSLLKGTVLEENSNGRLKIALSSGDELDLPYALVQSIKKDKNQELVFSNGSKSNTKGFYQLIEFGMLPGYTDELNTQLLWGLTGRYAVGYRFHPLLAVGAGVGVDYYNQFMMPAFVDVRGYFLKKVVSPYYSLNVGYGSTLQFRENWVTKKGGLMLRPALGLRIARAKHVFNINVGYQVQKARASRVDWGGGTTMDRITYRRWVIGVGWEF